MSGTALTIFQLTAKRLGATVLPDLRDWEYRMEIRSQTSNRLYVVARRKSDHSWGCDCPGWKNARNGVRKCKHLTAMVPVLENALRNAAPKRIG